MRALPLGLSLGLLLLVACERPPSRPAAPVTTTTADRFDTSAGPLTIHPVQHATFWPRR